MKNYIVSSLIALGVTLAATAAAQAKTVSCPDTTPAQIEGLFTEFNNAWATKDPAKVTALFTKEPVLLATVSNSLARHGGSKRLLRQLLEKQPGR